MPKKAVTENPGIKCSLAAYPFLDHCPDWLSYLGQASEGWMWGHQENDCIWPSREKERGLRVKGFKKCKNRGPKGSLKQGIPDPISQRHLRNQQMPPGTSLSGDRTAKESWKRSYPTVGIPPVKLPSHGAVGVQLDRTWQRLMVSSLTRWVYWARQTQHGCPFIISRPSGYITEMLNKTSGTSPFTAKTAWVRNFSQQLQDYYRRRNITNNIMDPTGGKKDIKAYMLLQLKGKAKNTGNFVM